MGWPPSIVSVPHTKTKMPLSVDGWQSIVETVCATLVKLDSLLKMFYWPWNCSPSKDSMDWSEYKAISCYKH